MKFIDLSGKKIGRWLVLNRAENNKFNRTMWNCICECGTTRAVQGSTLHTAKFPSCGCLKSELTSKRLKKYDTTLRDGFAKKEYQSWADAKKRCYNKNSKHYKLYGARGVVMCDEWKYNFQAFYDYMGSKPNDGQRWSLGRKDNNKNYEPGNVRWEIDEQQAKNHCLQSNNGSGTCGVAFIYRSKLNKTSVVAHIGYMVDKKKQKECREFSIQKYGLLPAFSLASSWRRDKEIELANKGIIFADTHGSERKQING